MDIRFHRRLRGEYFQNGGRACHAAAQQNSKDDLRAAANFVLVTFSVAIILKLSWRYWFHAGVNKKPKKFKTVWHGFRGILKLSGRVNQAGLKLSAGFSNTVCWTS